MADRKGKLSFQCIARRIPFRQFPTEIRKAAPEFGAAFQALAGITGKNRQAFLP